MVTSVLFRLTDFKWAEFKKYILNFVSNLLPKSYEYVNCQYWKMLNQEGWKSLEIIEIQKFDD